MYTCTRSAEKHISYVCVYVYSNRESSADSACANFAHTRSAGTHIACVYMLRRWSSKPTIQTSRVCFALRAPQLCLGGTFDLALQNGWIVFGDKKIGLLRILTGMLSYALIS